MLTNASFLKGLTIHATDGELGTINQFYFDDETWAIRYLVVNTGHWLSDRKVLVSPQWIENASWDDSRVIVNLTREAIKNSPELTEDLLLSRNYEIGLHGHYSRDGYWTEEFVKH